MSDPDARLRRIAIAALAAGVLSLLLGPFAHQQALGCRAQSRAAAAAPGGPSARESALPPSRR